MNEKQRRSHERAIAQGLVRLFGKALAIIAFVVTLLAWVLGSHGF